MAKLPKYYYFVPKINGTTITIEDRSDRDVVEVVRCSECIHHEDEEPGMVYCPNITGELVHDDFYCRDGKNEDEKDG